MVLEKIKGKEDKRNGTKYEFFSGKGGVGKTTLSAARAIYLAEKGNKVLIISTDPAHSLSDSFEKDIKGEETELKENLYGVEINPDKAVDDFKEKVSEEEVMDSAGMFGGEGLGNIASTTPGIDEMAAFNKFIQYLSREEYDYIIFDTAPTGHTLRFLSLPDLMESWVGKILKIKKKLSQFSGMFKNFMPFGEEEEEDTNERDLKELEKLKERVKEARNIMQDSEKTTFWMVMIPEEMSLYEGEKMEKELQKYGISCEKIIVNKLLPENTECDFCSSKREQQLQVLDSIKHEFEDKNIQILEWNKKEIKGYQLLRKTGQKLYK